MPTLAALFKMLLKLNCILHLESFHTFEPEQQFPICFAQGRNFKVQYKNSVVLFSCPSLRFRLNCKALSFIQEDTTGCNT